MGKTTAIDDLQPNCLQSEYIIDLEMERTLDFIYSSFLTIQEIHDTTLIVESEEKLKSLLMKGKEESEKSNLKFNIQKIKIMASSSITLQKIDGETMETVTDFIFLGSKIAADGD